MTVWFRSDDHFSHRNIILYAQRPFANVDEMNQGLIDRHNTLVQKDDDVFHLGDFSLSEKVVPGILAQLNGNHYLVAGNHDRCHKSNGKKHEDAIQRYLSYGFKEVHQETKFGPFLLNHLPYSGDRKDSKERFPTYRPKDDGVTWLLHGHCHGSMGKITGSHSIDVGVDVWDFKPVLFEELLAIKDEKDNVKRLDHRTS